MSTIFQRLLGRPIHSLRRDPEPRTSISITTSPKHELVDHQGWVQSFVFLQDNEHIVSSSNDGTMHKWDCETGLLVGDPWIVEDRVCALALSPDGKTIACGRGDGSVQRRDTDGQMIEGIWTGHRDWVRALSWSPSGHHLASGSDDGTILIRNAQSGEVEVSPINANQGGVYSVAYSPSGDRIASGGDNISIWDSHTGELRVGPIQADVYSIVWSLDGSKLYSSGWFARVFDSASGTELHRFQHDSYLYSIAISPKHNILAGVGRGIAQLWDTESYQSPGQPFHGDISESYLSVSFSPDGRYLAYGGMDRKITLRSTQELLVPRVSSINLPDDAQQEALPKSPSSACLDTNLLAQSAVRNDNEHNEPYNSFFTPSKSSLPLPLPKLSAVRRFKAALSPRVPHLRTPKGKLRTGSHDKQCDGVNRPRIVAPGATERGHDKGKQQEEPNIYEEPSSSRDTQQEALPKSPSSSCLDTNLLAQSAVKNDNGCSQPYNSFFAPSTSSLPLPFQKPSAVRRFRTALSPRVLHLRTLKGKLGTRSHNEECDGASRPGIVAPGATECNRKQREEPSSSRDFSSPAELGSNENRALWKLLQSRKINGKKSSTRETQCSSPEVVEVFTARGFKRIIVHKRKRKTKSPALISSNPTALANVGESSQVAPLSHGNPANRGIPGPSSQPTPIAGYAGQSSLTGTCCTDNDNDSCSDSSTIQGPCLRFLEKICFSY